MPEKQESLDGKILTANKQMAKSLDALLKLEDRLFLNPVSRIKNVPKTPKEKGKKDPNGELFD
jgi:hypothetical protein